MLQSCSLEFYFLIYGTLHDTFYILGMLYTHLKSFFILYLIVQLFLKLHNW